MVELAGVKEVIEEQEDVGRTDCCGKIFGDRGCRRAGGRRTGSLKGRDGGSDCS